MTVKTVGVIDPGTETLRDHQVETATLPGKGSLFIMQVPWEKGAAIGYAAMGPTR